jgi:hypothetical protein
MSSFLLSYLDIRCVELSAAEGCFQKGSSLGGFRLNYGLGNWAETGWPTRTAGNGTEPSHAKQRHGIQVNVKGTVAPDIGLYFRVQKKSNQYRTFDGDFLLFGHFLLHSSRDI